MEGAFVTGGSGFIGGRLVERLVGDGVAVRALARSDRAADAVRVRGAEPVRGDLDDLDALVRGMRGCEVVFHAAAHVEDWGDPKVFERVNVLGTRRVLQAALRAGVRRVVHVGTEAALLAGQALVGADESTPLRPDSPALYARTKARAEEEVILAPHGIEAVVVRPRFVWGRGDTTLLPTLVEQVNAGRFAWIDGGGHRTSTTHVDNCVEGLVLAASRGRDRGVWFVLDDGQIRFSDMIRGLLATHGLEVEDRSIPFPAAMSAATAAEALWRALPLPGRPPLTRFMVWVSAVETTLSDVRAREELGYAPVISREEGFADLQRAFASSRV